MSSTLGYLTAPLLGYQPPPSDNGLAPSPNSEPSDHAPDEPHSSQGLSPAAWAAISAIAVALISGLVTVIVTLFPGPIKSPLTGQESESSLPPVENSDSIDTTTVAIAGRWSGNAELSSGERYPLEVTLEQGCRINQRCGTISILSIPCHGELFLKEIKKQEYEFDVKNFDSSSDESCKPGAGEYFTPLSNGSLAYRAAWGVKGILDPVQ